MNSDQLIDNYLKGSLSKRESVQMNKWVKKDLKNLNYFKERIRSHSYVIPLNFDSDKAFDRFYQKIQEKKRLRKQRLKIFYWAASFTALIGLGLLYQNSELLFTEQDNIADRREANESLKEIQVTLSDGSQHRINKKSTISLKDKSGRLVASQLDNILSFEAYSSIAKDTSTTQIDIPYGEKLRLRLSDGSLVWLNSGSSLSFPQHFSSKSKTREVNVVGEAYFEISKNKQKPFIVHTPSVSVKVLGTHFNISSYANDSKSETTLMEGKVQVYNSLQINTPVELVPNQQAVFEKTNQKFEKKTVDADAFNSWIDNILVVDGLSFLELKRKLERKYNITITNELDYLWEKTYRGEFKDESLAETLKTIALSSKFSFSIDGKHIRIFNKNPKD
ncbi:anti-sigma factor FecR-like protein [Psychroflexus torquis ATCC 700755]|uniref:Anti-sigma factor FecR-like protein n=1 Tax=Psychroflexus torquis (strain ATCC 700755 / CIP 106069 / ACAM 623) TaxID=313595 RepID=K4IH68_PSYTT|nr:FecR family protein [Psychroflexus torquis]AFU69882.1 anti-sigma factor FecR-like protein [Psychroflexus torquis ATCC 700755]